MKPPNYREGTSEEHCGNCGAFSRPSHHIGANGYCRMFKQPVAPNMVCDKWYPRKKLVIKR